MTTDTESIAPPQTLADRPWRTHSAGLVEPPPTMLMEQELNLLHWLTSSYYQGAGLIVDAGCFLGGSTNALATGLAQNALLQWPQKVIHSYDIFSTEGKLWNDFLQQYGLQKEQSFEAIYRRNLSAHLDRIEVHAGNLLAQTWGCEPIEILFLDICKSPALHDHATKMWFPRLIPGRSIVIQQDYGWLKYYWGNVMMEVFKDHFDVLDDVPVASRVYLCTRAITEQDAADKVWSKVSSDDKLRHMDDALRSVGDSDFRSQLLVNYALLAEDLGRRELVEQILKQIISEGRGAASPVARTKFSSYLDGPNGITILNGAACPPIQKRLLSSRFEYREDASPCLSVSPAQEECILAFREHLKCGRYRLVHEACPCGVAGDDVVIAEIDRYALPLRSVLCSACGTVRSDPYLDEESLNHFYSDLYQEMYARVTSLPGRFAHQKQYGERILQTYRAHLATSASVLEVGCGTGGSIAALQNRGYRTAGCDFGEELLEYGAAQGVSDLWRGSIDDAPPQLAGRRYDLIYLYHVLEHVAHPQEMLNRLRQILAPGGRILAVVPDLGGIDSHRNPAGDALKFFHVAHKFNFTPKALTEIGLRSGLSAQPIVPPARDAASQSDAEDFPELWFEFSLAAAAAVANNGRSGEGVEMLSYLQQTEQSYLAGQCSSQRTIAARQESASVKSPLLSTKELEADMSLDPVRVFIGSGEASVLERKALVHSLRKNTRRKLEIYVLNGTHNAIELNDDPPFPAPMSLRVKYRNYTEFSLYRFLIPELCGHQGRGIYLDSDMICLGDIGELFDTPMDGADFLSVRAYDSGQWGPSVMLIDCQRSRFDLERICDEIDAGAYSYSEFTRMADSYLAHHPHTIGVLDPNWNVFDHCDESTKLIHYTNLLSQPWKFPGHPHGDLWFEYFCDALASGVITEEDVTKSINRGYVRTSIREGNQSPPPVILVSCAALSEPAPVQPMQVELAPVAVINSPPRRQPSWLKRFSRRLRGKV